ncbi:MAG TPA: hypothetical protein DCP08_06545 [Chloroflexi bacterium]|nr:hypothetical protein [Chloroflexota bacterium]
MTFTNVKMRGSTREEDLLLEITPPRDNERDAAAVQDMLAALSLSEPFSLEIAGEAGRKRFLARGSPRAIEHLRSRLAGIYPQAGLEVVNPAREPRRDPARVRPRERVLTMELYLRRGPHLPIKTYTTYQEERVRGSDPLLELLSALGGGGRALTQLILRPAPDNWSERYLDLARQRHWQEQKASPRGQAAVGIFFLMVFGALFLFLRGFFWWLEGLRGHALLAGMALFVSEAALFYPLRALTREDDPQIVREKVHLPAFETWLRIAGFAEEEVELEERMWDLVSAYGLYNFPAGNGFLARKVVFDPADIRTDPVAINLPLLGRGLRAWWARKPILNVRELASLWHLPLGEVEVQGLRHAPARVVLPVTEVSGEGILLGHSVHQGGRVEVRLPFEILHHNIFLVGKTQRGKSNLMHLLAESAMAAGDRAVVVIDPHVDLVRSLQARIPPGHEERVILIDLFDREFPVGINLLEYRRESPIDRDKVVADIIDSFSDIWVRFWGPRMEIYLRWALLTLAEYNRTAQRQMTILEVNLLLSDERFRADILRQIRDPEIHRWWREEYEPLRLRHSRFLIEVISPIKTKIDRFVASTIAKNVLGQPQSTVDIEREIQDRKIILVNLASGLVGKETASLLGSAILDILASVFRHQAQEERGRRALATVIVDEIQAIEGSGRKYKEFLQELSKFGANVVLGTQSLAMIEVMEPGLKGAIFANSSTLFLFESSAEDARYLVEELDRPVSVADLTNLGPYRCYVKTLIGRERIPVFTLETLPPQPGRWEQAERVRLLSRKEYGRHRTEVEAERTTYIQERYYPVILPVEKVVARAPAGSLPYPNSVPREKRGGDDPGEAAGEAAKAPHHIGGASAEAALDEDQRLRRNRARRQRPKKNPG